MEETVLVTGGAGFIGSHLVDALIEEGHRVRVLDNLDPQVHGSLHKQGRPPAYLHPDAEFLFGDVCDAQAVRQALEGVDVVFHQAARVGVGQSMYQITSYTQANALGAAVLLQAVVDMDADVDTDVSTKDKARPRKLIVASSMSIYGEGAYRCPAHGVVYPRLRPVEQLAQREWELRCPMPGCRQAVEPLPTGEDKPLHPTSIYAVNKRDHEEMFLAVGHAYNLPTVALRYFNTYGTRQALSNPYTGVAAIFSGRLLSGKAPVIYEDGLQQRDFTHVSDIVQANLLAMHNPAADYGTFNVGTGRALTILDVARALIAHLPQASGRVLPGGRVLPEGLAPEVTGQFRAGDIRHCTADISKLKSLGYQPKVSFEQGIAGLVAWVQSQTPAAQGDGFERVQQELSERGLKG